MTRTEYHRLDAPSLGGSAEMAVHGHWGRPVIWFPSARAARPGTSRPTACSTRCDRRSTTAGSPCSACLVRPRLLVGVLDAADRSGPQPPPVRGLDHLAGGAVHPGPLRRPRRRGDRRAVDGRLPRGAVRAAAPARVRPGGRRCPATTTRGAGAAGVPPTTTPTSPTRCSSCPAPTAVTWTTCGPGWPSPWWWAAACGRTPPARTRSTRALAGVLADKQIPHELFVWGHEWPHDWPSWRAQAAVYLPALG